MERFNRIVMTVDELAKRLGSIDEDGHILAVDCRYWLAEPHRGREAYLAGHVPGAIYLDMNQDLSSEVKEHGGRHPLPDPEQLAAKLTASGVTKTSTIVAYDEQGGSGASRLWWLLQWIGHEGEVFLLDGGWKAWLGAELPVEQGECKVAASIDALRYEPNLQPQLLVSMEEVKSRLGRSDVVMIDSRDGARYRGEVEPIDRVAGHIPGAVNEPWQGNLSADESWKSTEEQRKRWSEVVGDAKEIIVYCGSGVTACPNVLGLWQAGYRHAKLYPGSWSDWSSYEDNPVATGEE